MAGRPLRRGVAAGLAGLAAGLAAAGCGGDEGAATGTATATPLGPQLGGSVAPLAQCRHWAAGSRPRKLATIADIRSQVSRGDTGIKAPPLSDDEAMALFDRACAPSYARGFRLYVLYARSAGFAPLLRD